MKTILILRHAKSSWSKPGLADIDRPLNKRGKRDAPRMGAFLHEQMSRLIANKIRQQIFNIDWNFPFKRSKNIIQSFRF